MRNYEYLVAVAEHGHFGKAAKECCVTQPTLSLGIKELERQLGFDLVHRQRRYMGLTGEGEIVVAYARRMLKLRDNLGSTLAHYRSRRDAPLVFGTMPSGVGIVAHIGARLGKLDLSRNVVTATATRDGVARAVIDGEMDLGITHLDHGSSDLHVLACLSDDEAYLVAPHGMKLEGPSVSIDDLERLPLCHLSTDNYNAEIRDCLSIDAGDAHRPRLCAGSAQAVRSHLGQHFWYAVVPHGLLGEIAKDGCYWARPISTRIASPKLAIVSRPVSAYSQKKREIIECVRQTALRYVESAHDVACIEAELKGKLVPPLQHPRPVGPELIEIIN